MTTIPEGILKQISEDRPDLVWLCEKIRHTRRKGTVCEYERLLATYYLKGDSQLTQEETFRLFGCVAGGGYKVSLAA